MLIEKVTVADAEALLAIYSPYVENTAVSFEVSVPSIDDFKNRITQITQRFPYYKAVIDGEIVGYAYANSFRVRKAYDWCVETTVYIKPTYKRQGIGNALYTKLEEALKQMGVQNMIACVARPRGKSEYLTDDSYQFHCNKGFEVVGRFHNCGNKFGKWFDMVWMEKMIGTHQDNPLPVSFGEC